MSVICEYLTLNLLISIHTSYCCYTSYGPVLLMYLMSLFQTESFALKCITPLNRSLYLYIYMHEKHSAFVSEQHLLM